MKYEIKLTDVPNQVLSTSINGHSFTIALRTFRGIVYASIDIDNETSVSGARCIRDQGILPKRAAINVGGNFVFSTFLEDYPMYKNFDGATCRLLFEDGVY